MATLTRDALLQACAQPLPSEAIDVPELGGRVTVRGMSGTERDVFEMSLSADLRRHRTPANVRARLVVRCLVDDQGARLLTDVDAETLGTLRADVLDRLSTLAQRLSGFVSADITELARIVAPSHDQDAV